jgi:integrase
LPPKAPDLNTKVFLQSAWLADLRIGEALALEWEASDAAPWVDLDRDRIIFPAEFVKAAEDQWVPLDPELREVLLSLPRSGRKVSCFMSARLGRPRHQTTISDLVSQLAKKAGVKLSMHSLRKGFGCRYAGKVPAQVLQRLMRHANIKITMDYYANVDEAVEAAVLGEQRNRKRNTPDQQQAQAEGGVDANPARQQ